MPRQTWEEYSLSLALAASERSEDPHQKVGACALAKDNRVLALGYNGLAAGVDMKPELWADRDLRRPLMIHAEANCLSMVRAGECAVLASTLLPCSYCATMIASYRIPKVVYSEEYERDSRAKDIFNFYGIELKKI